MAHAFWNEGYNLLLVARSAEMLERLVGSLGVREGQVAVTIPADLADPIVAGNLVRHIRSRVPHIDTLINNAATQGPIGPLCENNWDEWLKAIQIDLLSPVALCRAVAPWMIEQGGGSIINLSGGGATGPRANFTAYATAKSGLVRFSETLAEELQPHNVRVNCIAPGAMNTKMLMEVISSGQDAAGEKEHALALKVQRDGGASMQRVADLCLFLVSDSARSITGKLISAMWDNWENFPHHLKALETSDVYTLRRIVAKDRGFDWGDK